MTDDLLMQLRSYRKQFRFGEMNPVARFLDRVEKRLVEQELTTEAVVAFMAEKGIKLLPWQLDKLGR